MTQCLIAIGCNQGDCRAAIHQAFEKIDQLPSTQLLSTSELLKTDPVGPLKGTFLNGALLVETQLPPQQLLQHLLKLESAAGRQRTGGVDARPLDLDILLFGQEIIKTKALWVPHPRMAFRSFALNPAAQIAPDMLHPEIGISLAKLAQQLRQRPNIIAVALPRPFAFEAMEMDLRAQIIWAEPENAAAARELLQTPLPRAGQWLVLLAKDSQILATTETHAKLRIIMSAVGGAEQISESNAWAGPSWHIPLASQTQFRKQIATAIQSMAS